MIFCRDGSAFYYLAIWKGSSKRGNKKTVGIHLSEYYLEKLVFSLSEIVSKLCAIYSAKYSTLDYFIQTFFKVTTIF